MRKSYLLSLVSIILLSSLCLVTCVKKPQTKTETKNPLLKIVLCDHCPPGFEQTDSNTCLLVSQYQQYKSLQNQGVGGLKTALPKYRDGFSPQQIDLGRYLFFDPVLSSNKKLACASCHNPDLGFSDAKTQSSGFNDSVLLRSAPSLWNVAFLHSFFWDARANSLEEQMKGPLYAANEMNTNPELLLKTLNGIEDYRRLFALAFPLKKTKDISLEEIYTCITAFECSLISLNSRYDQYAHGYEAALTKNEIEGLNVFRSFVARCSECHTPPLFSNQQIAVLGVPERTGKSLDIGAESIIKDSSYRAGFKVPSLRNVALTAPYMHAGVFKDLRQTVSFYNEGRGHAADPQQHLKIHWHIWEPHLTDKELDRLVDFLKVLTDESFKPTKPNLLPSGINLSNE